VRVPVRCLVTLGVLVVLAAGCSAGDRDEGAGRRDDVLEQCSQKIDSQIEAGLIPNADREYATGMCLRVP
jgi:hypothetical protein